MTISFILYPAHFGYPGIDAYLNFLIVEATCAFQAYLRILVNADTMPVQEKYAPPLQNEWNTLLHESLVDEQFSTEHILGLLTFGLDLWAPAANFIVLFDI